MLHLEFPTEGLRGADYNPRAIASDALVALQESIRTCGFVKPIIVTQDGLIVAGHQRTKASRAMGRTHVPAWVLKEISKGDEVRFNQLHNGTDLDDIDSEVAVPPTDPRDWVPGAFEEVQPDQIDGNLKASGAAIRSEIAKLVIKYGPWGASVATHSGKIVASPQYALACKWLGIPCRVSRVPDAKGDEAKAWLTRPYGEFSYDHLQKDSWIQSYAQPRRLRKKDGDIEEDWGKLEAQQSRLYEEHVLPHVKKTDRLLDFGAGQGDYVRQLKRLGYNIRDIEFFRRKGDYLDTVAVHEMIDAVIEDVKQNGLYDGVICDSVINSVDSAIAEDDVLACVNALCKMGGRIFLAARGRGQIDDKLKIKSTTQVNMRLVEFLDKDGFTAIFRHGTWFYQKFYTKEQMRRVLPYMTGDSGFVLRQSASAWQSHAFKKREFNKQRALASIRREFELPWPEDRTVGRGDAMCAALESLLPDGPPDDGLNCDGRPLAEMHARKNSY